MILAADEAKAYLESDKVLVQPQGWRPKDNRVKKHPVLFFESRVRISTVLPRGLRFRVSIFPTFPDMATFQLDCELPPARTCLPLYRLEWRPLAGHGNSMDVNVPEELRGLVFHPGETHEHICTDCMISDRSRLTSAGVHAARRVEPDFQTYEAALAYVCDKLRIRNGRDIPPPNAQAEMWV